VITLPCGKTDAGLPVGLQIIGKPHGELELFALASYLEQVFGWDGGRQILYGNVGYRVSTQILKSS